MTRHDDNTRADNLDLMNSKDRIEIVALAKHRT